MINVKHTCETCDSQFTINFDEELCEDSPHFCPFCGEMIIEEDSEYEKE